MLDTLVVRDFRNLAALDLTIDAAGLAIVGDNGHGKTNLLEAVAYLRLLRSWRGARDADVVRFGAAGFHVRATLHAPARVHTAALGFERATRRKRALLDGVEQSRLSDALGALPSVCFSPADVALVAGGPGERRRFLDVALALTNDAYLVARVSVWEPALAEHGATLVQARRAWVMAHAEPFGALCAAIGEPLAVTLRYQGAVGDDAPDTVRESLLRA
nr:hypothetical protein [Gemmatimonadaceae bacterium]